MTKLSTKNNLSYLKNISEILGNSKLLKEAVNGEKFKHLMCHNKKSVCMITIDNT